MKNSITRPSSRRLKIIITIHVLWLATICLLGAWWGKLVLIQAERITELEAAAGMAASEAHDYWERTQRMLFWESATFFALLIGISGLLAFLYWRDWRRTRSLHAFFASLTHELRTPLTSIRLQAESLADMPAGDPAASGILGRLLEDTQRLETQVERTLELSRIEGGGMVLVEPLRLRPVVERVLLHGMHGSAAGDSRLSFDAKIGSEVIEADPRAIEIILRNLFENTHRHSGREDTHVTLTSRTEGDSVVLTYHDDGQGFSGNASHLGRIFHKGSQSKGAGVGLYLVRTLMKRMGGKAEFGSTSEGFQADLRFRKAESNE